MRTPSLTGQFEMLRAQLEFSLPEPSIIVVSSARAGEGKRLTAVGLARSMRAAGYLTLLVDADSDIASAPGSVEAGSLAEICELGLQRFAVKTPDVEPDLLLASSENIRRAASRENIAQLYSLCRTNYHYTVVDAATILNNNLGLLLAAAADGVLLTIRTGRRVHAYDKRVVTLLEREDGKLLGVVSVLSSAIRGDDSVASLQGTLNTTNLGSNAPADGKRPQKRRQLV